MPHYKDGTEAKVGDHVTGHLFNSGPGLKAGTIISITPGSESCNAMVQFTEATSTDATPRMAVRGVDGFVAATRDVQGESHGTAGPVYHLFTCVDYCDVSGLTKVPS